LDTRAMPIDATQVIEDPASARFVDDLSGVLADKQSDAADNGEPIGFRLADQS
jgi:hypothetical protein